MRNLIPVLIFGLLSFNIEAEEIIVYGHITGQYADHSAEFARVASRSIDSLRRFESSNKRSGFVPAKASITDKLSAARKNKISWVADVKFVTEKRNGSLSFEIYNSLTGENTFRWKQKFRVRNIRALMAEFQYKMPEVLKNRYLETGRIIKKDERVIYFDLGESAGIQTGDIYQVYVQGMEIQDQDGNLFGYVDESKGIVKVIEVTPVYSVAEIMLGQMNIKPKQLIRKVQKARSSDYEAALLSVLENQVAINVGKNVGVQEGSYYSIYRDIEKINSREAFRKPIGVIRINEVFDDFSKGELSISETFEMSKYTIKKGDRVIEVESPRKNMWSANQLLTNIGSDTPAQLYYGAYQRDSAVNVDLSYRIKAGYGSDIYFAGGVMHALNHSNHVFAGIDVVYIGSTAMNLFLSVDVDTPLSRNLKINLESGYTVSAENDAYNGINTSLGLKYGFDLF